MTAGHFGAENWTGNWVRLSDVSQGRDNNLNLIRMVAALAVLVSHAWALTTGSDDAQPLGHWIGFRLGDLGVFAFFAISGFLVTRSFERQPTVSQWMSARALRIFPALFVVLVLTALVLGPAVTSLPVPAYLRDPATWSYVPINLTLVFRQISLPGVFEAAPDGPNTNQPLWTLYYEVLCYGLVLALGLAGAFRSRRVLIVAAGLYVLANVAWVLLPVEWPEALWALRWLSTPFVVGLAFYLARTWLPLTAWGLVPLAAAAFAAHGSPLYQPLFVLALSYGVFLLAYLPRGWVRQYNRLGDYSYGVYIYAWPVQQMAVHSFGPMSPVQNILVSVPVVLGLAWLSWNLVEKPALGLLPARSGGGGGR